MIKTTIDRILQWIWGRPPEDYPWQQRWAVLTCRMVYVLIRDMSDGQLTLRAMGLVYTSLLSLVPLLALGFSMLKAFGINDVLRPTLARFLAPLGQNAESIINMIVGFVDNVQVGVLGIVGLALLLYSVISLIQKVESGCNYIWQVHHPRSLSRRFSDYLSVLIVGPLVIIAATSMTASVTSNTLIQHIAQIQPFGATLFVLGRLVPYLLYSAGFTFLFLFIPNTKVRLVPALFGGVFAGILWQTASLAFALFASSAGNVNAIYSSFAILIFLLIWLYVSWLIMLLGCRVAFLLQYPEQLKRQVQAPELRAAREEQLALLIMALVGQHFIRGQQPWRADQMSRHLQAEPEHVFSIVDRLVASNMLNETAEDNAHLLPARSLDNMTVYDVLQATRTNTQATDIGQRDAGLRQHIQQLTEHIDSARLDALAGKTVRQLAQDCADLHETDANKGTVAPTDKMTASR